jgi:hypothetical protein
MFFCEWISLSRLKFCRSCQSYHSQTTLNSIETSPITNALVHQRMTSLHHEVTICGYQLFCWSMWHVQCGISDIHFWFRTFDNKTFTLYKMLKKEKIFRQLWGFQYGVLHRFAHQEHVVSCRLNNHVLHPPTIIAYMLRVAAQLNCIFRK